LGDFCDNHNLLNGRGLYREWALFYKRLKRVQKREMTWRGDCKKNVFIESLELSLGVHPRKGGIGCLHRHTREDLRLQRKGFCGGNIPDCIKRTSRGRKVSLLIGRGEGVQNEIRGKTQSYLPGAKMGGLKGNYLSKLRAERGVKRFV